MKSSSSISENKAIARIAASAILGEVRLPNHDSTYRARVVQTPNSEMVATVIAVLKSQFPREMIIVFYSLEQNYKWHIVRSNEVLEKSATLEIISPESPLSPDNFTKISFTPLAISVFERSRVFLPSVATEETTSLSTEDKLSSSPKMAPDF